MNRTKIVCTIGPASTDPEVLRRLIRAGMNVARLNFSHGSHDSHAENIARIRQIAQDEGRVVGLLQDLQGPRIRVGDLSPDQMTLVAGSTVTLTNEPIVGSGTTIPIRGADLAKDVQPGATILIADGEFELRVVRVEGPRMIAEVIVGGVISSHKGINVPGVTLSIPSFTEKDRDDLLFGLSQKVDWVAMSFVRSAADIDEVRSHILQARQDIPIMAKIEKHEAVDNFDQILEAVDGIMVARGDLGIEMPAEDVPIIQKSIIAKCNRVGKPVVTATQMLNSMIENPHPTRAEASDVANAILDGTDAVMLSGETAVGAYPVEAVATMARIAMRAEAALPYGHLAAWRSSDEPHSGPEAISQATVEIAEELNAKTIVTLTQTGYTARQVAKHRPRTPILAVTIRPTTQQRLTMVWGVQTELVDAQDNPEQMIRAATDAVRRRGLAEQGDTIVITAGVPTGGPGRTNLLRIEIVD